MTKWERILDSQTGKTAMTMFASGNLSCESVQQVFRAGVDREVSGEVRRLIRDNGTQYARRLTRKALRRRSLMQ